MKKKLLAVILSVFIATTALPETAVMAAAVQESIEETVVSSGSVDNTETDSDVTSSESKTEIGSTVFVTDSERFINLNIIRLMNLQKLLPSLQYVLILPLISILPRNLREDQEERPELPTDFLKE